MSEDAPAKFEYVLRDILELERHRVACEQFDIRRRQTLQPVYRDRPGNSATSQFHSDQCWLALNSPHPGRLRQEEAFTLPLYRRLVRTAQTTLRSALTPDILSHVIAEILDGTEVALSEAWDLPLVDFERLWDAKMRPVQSLPVEPPAPPAEAAPITLRAFFEQMANSERFSAYAEDESRPIGTADELHSNIQAKVTAVSLKQMLEGTPGYDALRTLVFRKLASPLTTAVAAKISACLLNQYPELTASKIDGLTLEEVGSLWDGRSVAKLLPSTKKKRGRRAIDHKQDRRIWDAWHTGSHESYAALARALGIKSPAVEAAMDRERKRQKRQQAENSVNPE